MVASTGLCFAESVSFEEEGAPAQCLPHSTRVGELWVVATRPVEVNGFGWNPSKTADATARLHSRFVVLDEGPAAFDVAENYVGRICQRSPSNCPAPSVECIPGCGAIKCLKIVPGFKARPDILLGARSLWPGEKQATLGRRLRTQRLRDLPAGARPARRPP